MIHLLKRIVKLEKKIQLLHKPQRQYAASIKAAGELGNPGVIRPRDHAETNMFRHTQHRTPRVSPALPPEVFQPGAQHRRRPSSCVVRDWP